MVIFLFPIFWLGQCDEAIEITQHKGMRPDIVNFYINNDKKKFQTLIKKLVLIVD